MLFSVILPAKRYGLCSYFCKKKITKNKSKKKIKNCQKLKVEAPILKVEAPILKVETTK